MSTTQKTEETGPSLSALIKIYELNQNWISLADTKGGLVLSANGVLMGFAISKIGQIKQLLSCCHCSVIIALLIISITGYIIFQLLSCFHALAVVIPRQIKRDDSETAHVFAYSIIQKFPKITDTARFVVEVEKMSAAKVRQEIITQMHIDALVCSAKYQNSLRSIRYLVIAASFAIISFIMLALV